MPKAHAAHAHAVDGAGDVVARLGPQTVSGSNGSRISTPRPRPAAATVVLNVRLVIGRPRRVDSGPGWRARHRCRRSPGQACGPTAGRRFRWRRRTRRSGGAVGGGEPAPAGLVDGDVA